MYKTSTSSYASKGFDFCLKSCLISIASDYFLPTSICVLHSNFWYLYIDLYILYIIILYLYKFIYLYILFIYIWYLYLHINSLLEWRFDYFHMFQNPVNKFMQSNLFPAVKTFTWTGAERHAWRNRYCRSHGQIVYLRNRRNGARLLQWTLNCQILSRTPVKISFPWGHKCMQRVTSWYLPNKMQSFIAVIIYMSIKRIAQWLFDASF